jgi:cold shock CspA family protein
MKIGKIVRFNSNRGFGFVEAHSGRRFYFHIRKWAADVPPEAGQTVWFDVGPAFVDGRPEEAINLLVVADIDAGALAAKTSAPKSEGAS